MTQKSSSKHGPEVRKQASEPAPASPEAADREFMERLKLLIGDEKPFAWASRVGIPSSTFARIWKAGTVPTAKFLRLIRQNTGVSLDWLLTGEGPMWAGEAAAAPAPTPVESPPVPLGAPPGALLFDEEILREVLHAVELVLARRPVPPAPAAKARLAAAMYRLMLRRHGAGGNSKAMRETIAADIAELRELLAALD